MALSEETKQDQVTIDSGTNSVCVRWRNAILKDGVEIASSYHRKAYSEYEYTEFLAEVENGAAFANLMGWVAGKQRPTE